MRILLGFIALGFLSAVCLARPSENESSKLDASDRPLIRVSRSDIEDEEPVRQDKKIGMKKKRSTEVHLNRKRRAEQEDEFFQALLSRSVKTKNEKKRSFDDNGADNKGFIIRDDWKGDSKISDADRTELANLFSAINSPEEEGNEKHEQIRSVNSKNENANEFIQWLVSQPPDKFAKSLSHMVDVETSLSKMLFNGVVKKPKGDKGKEENTLSDSAKSDSPSKGNSTVNETALEDPATMSDAAKKKFCETKCYDINVAGVNCRIICHPPTIDTTGGMQFMHQMPYPPYVGQQQSPCSPPSCVPGALQNPCSPPGCTPAYPQYPQVGYPQMGGVLPPQNIYPGQQPGMVNPPGYYMPHAHGKHHNNKKGKPKKSKDDGNSKKTKQADELQHDPIDPTEIDHEYEYEGPGSEEEVDYEHPHWLHHRPKYNGKDGEGYEEGEEPEGGGGGGGGGGGRKGRKGRKGGKSYPGVEVESNKAFGPVTLNTLGATVHITPMSFSSPGGPQMTPAHVGISPPQPIMATAPLLPQPPQYPLPSGYSLAPLPPRRKNEDQPAQTKAFQPMPNDCNDYNEERCKVFLDWPTDEKNQIKASLRFTQNWHPDYRKKGTTKYRIMKTEIERAMKDAYTQDPNFVKAIVTSFSEEDMKTTANFELNFLQAENGALRWLSRAISNNYLQSMPVYSSTLLRDGLKHLHRQIIPSQQELDQLPSSAIKEESTASKKHTTHKLLDTKSHAYQGCFRDKKPGRDLPVRFSKYEMTPEWCVGRCKLAGYKFSGLQYGYLCFCGNKFGKYGKGDDATCNSKCFGDKKRRCGSFWHNSIYSIDGQRHKVAEFANMSDDDDEDDDEDDGSTDEDAMNKLSGPGHAEVANNLMKAAESALKAAKKLIQQGKKNKRALDELEKDKASAIAALGAAQELMNADQQEREIKKRQIEGNDGRNLLVAYLANVGGYDREYRDVESQEDGADKNRKFEYRRMVIDESGDGEFVEKIDKDKTRRKREIVSWPEEFDGPKKMAARSVPEKPASDRREQIKRNNEVKPEEKKVTTTSGKEESDTNEDESTSGGSDETSAENKPEKEVDEGVMMEDAVSNDEADTGNARESRSVHNGEKVLRRRARDVEEDEEDENLEKEHDKKKKATKIDKVTEKKAKKTVRKRDIWVDDSKVEAVKGNIKTGIKNVVEMIFDLWKARKTIYDFRNNVLGLKEKVVKMLSVPENQRADAETRIRQIIDNDLPKGVEEFIKQFKKKISEYGQTHAAVAPQVSEAEKAILDLPVVQDEADEVKSRIKKRSAELEVEIKRAAVESLPSILKEHFKRNTDEQEKQKKKRSLQKKKKSLQNKKRSLQNKKRSLHKHKRSHRSSH